MNSEPWWRLEFEDGSAVFLQGDDPAVLSFKASMLAWEAKGIWWKITNYRREVL